MNPIATYTLHHFVNKAANKNQIPTRVLLRQYIKIGLILTPFILWLMWTI